jgi:hypothetical protein
MPSKTVAECEMDGALSDLFDGLRIAHNKVDHPIFKTFFQKACNAPLDYHPPCRKTLGGRILDQQYQVNLDERNNHLKHAGTRKFGMTSTTDGARCMRARARGSQLI